MGTGSTPDISARLRLTPEMVSLRLHVLGFVRRYLGTNKYSPSYGEIAAAVGIGQTAAKRAVKSLAAEGLLLRTPGTRGLLMPSEREASLRVLRALGWTVDEDARRAAPGGPNSTLPDTRDAA